MHLLDGSIVSFYSNTCIACKGLTAFENGKLMLQNELTPSSEQSGLGVQTVHHFLNLGQELGVSECC